MQKKKNIPALRFRGFNEEWEVESFDKSFTGISNNTLSRDKLNYNIGKSKNIHYGDVLVRFNEILDVKNKEVPFITDDKISDKLKPSKLKNGDVVFADAAEDEMVGKCVEVTNITNEVVYSGLHTIAVRPKVEFAKGYLGYYLNSKLYHNQFLNLMQGTKVLSISKTAIKTTTVKFPNSKPEQTKIGSFFENLDQLLTKHQTQHQKLQALKKAMLGKLFPKKGATTPEIRFKGFTGDWEEIKISNLFKVTRGSVLSASLTTDKKTKKMKYPVYSSQTKYNGLMGYYDEYLFENAVTWTTDGANAGTVKYRKGKFYSTNVNGVLLSDEGFASEVIAEILNNEAWKHVSHVGNPKLMNNVMADIKITIPNSIKEIEILSNYLNIFNSLITKHATQIEKLGTIKKACLSKMFV